MKLQLKLKLRLQFRNLKRKDNSEALRKYNNDKQDSSNQHLSSSPKDHPAKFSSCHSDDNSTGSKRTVQRRNSVTKYSSEMQARYELFEND